MIFDSRHIEKSLLQKQSYNMRWAEVDSDIIPLTAADLDLPCAAPIVSAIQEYAAKRCFNYGPAEGLPELKSAFSAYFKRKKDWNVSPANILPVDSAARGIHLVCQTLLEKGDEAIIFDPVDFLFRYSIEAVGGIAVSFSIPPGTEKVDFSELEMLIGKKTKLICLCNPLNPSGKVFTKAELFQLASIAEKHGLMILSDEVWSDIVFASHGFTSIASLDEYISDRTIVITGLSKSYGLAGLRIGAVATTNDSVYKAILKNSLHHSTIHGASTLSQVAAVAALNECDVWLDEFVVHLSAMRSLCVNAVNALDGFSCNAPEGCYVVFADIRKTELSSSQMSHFLKEQARVAVVPGLKEWFGGGAEGFIRISFATSEEILNEAFNRIRHTISGL